MTLCTNRSFWQFKWDIEAIHLSVIDCRCPRETTAREFLNCFSTWSRAARSAAHSRSRVVWVWNSGCVLLERVWLLLSDCLAAVPAKSQHESWDKKEIKLKDNRSQNLPLSERNRVRARTRSHIYNYELELCQGERICTRTYKVGVRLGTLCPFGRHHVRRQVGAARRRSFDWLCNSG